MASEYLLKKYKDVKPDEPRVMTKEEQRKNWFYYHRVHLAVAAALVVLIGSFVWEMIVKDEPDYYFGYIGEYALPHGSDEQIIGLLESMMDDRNGDGEVNVFFNSYVMNENDPNAYAQQVALVSDITMGNSSVFLVEDPMAVQSMFGFFYQEDGTLAEDTTTVDTCEAVAWSACPAVCDLNLEREYYLIHRGFSDEELLSEKVGIEALWNVITAGADVEGE